MGLSVGVAAALAWLFFRTLTAVCVTFPAGVVFYLEQRKQALLRQEQERRTQCKDALLAVSGALSAGYALENAIAQARPGIVQIWGESGALLQEWDRMEAGLALHIPVEQAFEAFAARMQLPELTQLSGLLSIAKRSGGRMGSLIRTTAVQMEERIRVEEEIRNRLTEKRMELSIMLLMPPGILLYLQVCSYDIIAPLYETLWGRGFMAGCLLVYGLGWWLGMRILDIRM
jgi:tight adherence protein B